MLRVLARSSRPVFIATVVGHAVRCLFLRAGRVHPGGLCKARWISEVFGVDERNVKAARCELVRSGWLIVDPASQRFLNRWGLPVRVNLCWQPLSIRPLKTARQSPPPTAGRSLESPPPLKNTHRFQRLRNHQPSPRSGLPGKPFRNIQIAELRSATGFQARFDEAVQAGLVRRCAADELRFAAAAERALLLGRSNPAGFFATLVRRRLWHVISHRDEDAARMQMLRRETALPLAPRFTRPSTVVAAPAPSSSLQRAGDIAGSLIRATLAVRGT